MRRDKRLLTHVNTNFKYIFYENLQMLRKSYFSCIIMLSVIKYMCIECIYLYRIFNVFMHIA